MRKTVVGLTALAAFVSTPALAASATNTMPVSVNIINSCTIAASPMAFGTLTSIGGSNVDTSADVALVCTSGAAYDVSMDFGTHVASGQRYLANTTDATKKIPYNIYSNSGRTATWGNTGGTGGDTVSGVATSGLLTIPAYGRIPASASPVSAGAYTDTVTVTVNF